MLHAIRGSYSSADDREEADVIKAVRLEGLVAYTVFLCWRDHTAIARAELSRLDLGLGLGFGSRFGFDAPFKTSPGYHRLTPPLAVRRIKPERGPRRRAPLLDALAVAPQLGRADDAELGVVQTAG
jgi:hypothetical protein